MKRRPVEWLAAPDEDDEPSEDGHEMVFKVTRDWFSVDADQLVLPIEVHRKTGISVEEPYTATLKQYGGEGLLNDMLLCDQDLEAGTGWILMRTEQLLTVEPTTL